MITFFDIETLCTTDPCVIADLEKTITAPATHKKQETIDKWMEENKASALKDLVAKTSFDGMYGRVSCIAWACDDGEIHSTGADDSEREAISKFYDYICFDVRTTAFCGHNLHSFDLPFLKHRSIILGIKPPQLLLSAMNAKPWNYCVADTMRLWDQKKMVSMSALCKILGIKDEDDMNGSMVNEMWKNNPCRVIQYCKNDVDLTRQLYKRLTFTN